jgi:hypothetical protein
VPLTLLIVFGFPGSDPSLPLFAYIFLVALGVDDNIFLMAACARRRRPEDLVAVRAGAPHPGRRRRRGRSDDRPGGMIARTAGQA